MIDRHLNKCDQLFKMGRSDVNFFIKLSIVIVVLIVLYFLFIAFVAPELNVFSDSPADLPPIKVARRILDKG